MEIERNLGVQPVAELMRKHDLKPHDLVAAYPEQMTHKLIGRAAKGRRLTPKSKSKVLSALNQAAGQNYGLKDLFNY